MVIDDSSIEEENKSPDLEDNKSVSSHCSFCSGESSKRVNDKNKDKDKDK